MRIRDRIALAWRGYWAEMRHDFQQETERTREEWRTWQAQWREAAHWRLMLNRKITGLDSPARKDVRRAVREYRKDQR